MTCRAPNFSQWLCRQYRKYKFKYATLAFYLDVSPQCIDSYANGRAHPQIMKFYRLVEFLADTRNEPYELVLLEAMESIRKDYVQKKKF